MKVFRVKVKATGEEIIVAADRTEDGVYVTADNRLFMENDLEFTETLTGGGAPMVEPRMRDFNPEEYLNRVLDMQRDNFWRDQRVEITKILLQRVRLESNATTSDVVKIADEIVQQLKACKD